MTKVTELLYDPWYEIDRDHTEGYMMFYASIFCTLFTMLTAFAALQRSEYVPTGHKGNKNAASKVRYEIVQTLIMAIYIPIGRGVLPELGIESHMGIILGYEFTGLVVEYMGYFGKPRAIMIAHHFGVVLGGLISYSYFYTIPLVERQFWWILFETCSFMMDSNVPLQLRNIFRGYVIFDIAFAVTFFYSRFYLQYGKCIEFLQLYGTPWPELPWRYKSTTFMYGFIMLFHCLNVYWGYGIIRMVIRKLSKKKKKDA
jgi:hypothetical protein